MSAQSAISRIVGSIPNLLSATVTERFTGKAEHVVHSQERVAEAIAAVLPGNLKAEGYLIVKLPNVEMSDTGRRSVRVPITAQRRYVLHGQHGLGTHGRLLDMAPTSSIGPHEQPAQRQS